MARIQYAAAVAAATTAITFWPPSLTGWRMLSYVEQRMREVSVKAKLDRLARMLTEVFAPAHLAVALLLMIGALSGLSALEGLAWGALAAVLVGVIPYAWLLYSVKRGRFASRHVPDRAQRILPLSVAGVAAVCGLLLIFLLGAPQPLVALVVAMVAGLAVTITVTRYWKISVHAAVAAGTATILTVVVGPVVMVSWAIVAAIGWSRVQLQDHNVAQVLAGAVVGSVVAAAVFAGLR